MVKKIELMARTFVTILLVCVFIRVAAPADPSTAELSPKTTNSSREAAAECAQREIQPDLYITVSSLTLPTAKNLELHWQIVPALDTTDRIALYQGDPHHNTSLQLDLIRPQRHNGSYRSQHTYQEPDLRPATTINTTNTSSNSSNITSRCSRYWIAHLRDGRVVRKRCLLIASSWMWDNRAVLGQFYPHQIMIPGTHNSGTYKRGRQLIFKLAANQDVDVWSQLMYGIRFLDLRVGRIGNRFWIHHDFFPIRGIAAIVQDVRLFLQRSQELLFIDFHRFPRGFQRRRQQQQDEEVVVEAHEEFVRYLVKQLGQWIKPRTSRMTLDEMWSSDRRLVISYADAATVKRHTELHHRLDHAWADSERVAGLHAFLDQRIQYYERRDRMWAAMAHLTPRAWHFLVPNRGLRDMAQQINVNVTQWFRRQWWRSANVVATDFFLGNDIVHVAIESNRRRANCSSFVT